jgi:23S rRNA (guanine2445-N2)-methyltransferase / 23S rRNA (guanine2069-N7)-methyltransferase
MAKTLDINRDHVELINLTMRLLEEQGMLIFSCNAKRFTLDEDKLANYTIQDLTKLTTSDDFKRKPLHKCWCISKKSLAEKITL